MSIGTCWASGSWVDDSWGVGTWVDQAGIISFDFTNPRVVFGASFRATFENDKSVTITPLNNDAQFENDKTAVFENRKKVTIV